VVIVRSSRHTPGLLGLSKGTLTAAILALTLAPLDASSPKTFQAATQADFLKGDVENLSIDSHGQLVLGPAIEPAEKRRRPRCGRWRPGPTGRCLSARATRARYASTRRERLGVLRQQRAREARARAGTQRWALRGDVARGPNLQSRSKRNSAPFFDPDEKYIWGSPSTSKERSVRRHGREGHRLQDRARRQRRAVLQDEGDARDGPRVRQGRQSPLGTESPGKVLRVDPEGKAFVLLDSAFQEIRALHFDDKGMRTSPPR
jgi:hypothetical protein